MLDDRVEEVVASAPRPTVSPESSEHRALAINRWMPLLLISLGTLVWSADASVFSVLLPDIQKSLRLGLSTVGLLGALFTAAQLVEPAVAYAADRIRRTAILVAELTILAICTALAAVAGWVGSLSLLYVSRGGVGLGNSVRSTRLSLLADYHPPQSRAVAFYALNFPQIFGQLIGPVVAGVVAVRLGWEAPFIILAVASLAMAGIVAAALREPARGRFELQPSGQAAPAPGFRRSVQLILSRPSMRWFYFLLPVGLISLLVMMSFSPIFFRQVFKVNTAGLGLVVAGSAAAQFAGLAAGAFFVSRAMKQGPGRALFVMGVFLAVQTLSFAAMPLAPSLPIALLAYLSGYGLLGALLPGVQTVIANVLPPHVRTFGLGLTILAYILAIPVLPLLGVVGDHYGVRTAILLTAPTSLAAIVVVYVMLRSIDADIAHVSEI